VTRQIPWHRVFVEGVVIVGLKTIPSPDSHELPTPLRQVRKADIPQQG
jgi:hypothetical protein